ncbi:hypothetical protein [Streptomyces aureus]
MVGAVVGTVVGTVVGMNLTVHQIQLNGTGETLATGPVRA